MDGSSNSHESGTRTTIVGINNENLSYTLQFKFKALSN